MDTEHLARSQHTCYNEVLVNLEYCACEVIACEDELAVAVSVESYLTINNSKTTTYISSLIANRFFSPRFIDLTTEVLNM